jgi:hypothetical protein
VRCAGASTAGFCVSGIAASSGFLGHPVSTRMLNTITLNKTLMFRIFMLSSFWDYSKMMMGNGLARAPA